MADRRYGAAAPETSTTVTGASWEGEDVSGQSDLHTASFNGVRLLGADLTGARCQGASIRDTDLSDASLHGANLTDCDLRGSDVSALNPGDCTITGAIVTYDQAIVIAQALGLDVRAE